MQSQGATQPADRHEQVDELRFGREHLGELVDDDEQRRQRGQVLAGRSGLLVVADRGVVPGLAEQFLASHHLPGQGVLHPVHEGQFVGQVGDHRGDVRHVGHAGEGRPTLEVDQDHVELLGGVRHRESEHQGAEELGLPGPGGPDAQTVRPHALLGGLLDVEVHQGPALAQPDRSPQPVAGRPRTPGRRRFETTDVAESEKIHEVARAGDLAGAGVRRSRGHRAQRHQASGQGLSGREVALVGVSAHRGLAQEQGLHRDSSLLGSRSTGGGVGDLEA